jgi:hypothetical protein
VTVFCPAFSNNIRIEIENNQSIYKPCCDIKKFNNYTDLDSYLNSEELDNLKKSTTFYEGCKSCELQEAHGQISLRNHFQKKFPVNIEGIQQFEIMPNDTCNLKCFMCGPAYSSALAKEYQSLGWIENFKSTDQSDRVIKLIKSLSSLKSISIIGGEFFLAKSNVDIIKTALDCGIEEFRAVTNCTIILDQHLELLSNFKKLEIQISLDGVSSSYEFMRYPSQWETVNANIKKMISVVGRRSINFQSVVQPLNLQHIVKTLEFTNRYIIPHRLKNLVFPTWLSWSILNNYEKELLSNLNDGKLPSNQKQQLQSIIVTMNSIELNQIDRQMFVEKMTTLLRHRQIDAKFITEHFGLLTDLRDQIIGGI